MNELVGHTYEVCLFVYKNEQIIINAMMGGNIDIIGNTGSLLTEKKNTQDVFYPALFFNPITPLIAMMISIR